jgi:hypothetical protein
MPDLTPAFCYCVDMIRSEGPTRWAFLMALRQSDGVPSVLSACMR